MIRILTALIFIGLVPVSVRATPTITCGGQQSDWDCPPPSSTTACGTNYWNINILRKDSGTADVRNVTIQVAEGDRICELVVGNLKSGSTVNVFVTTQDSDPFPSEIRQIKIGRNSNNSLQDVGRINIRQVAGYDFGCRGTPLWAYPVIDPNRTPTGYGEDPIPPHQPHQPHQSHP